MTREREGTVQTLDILVAPPQASPPPAPPVHPVVNSNRYARNSIVWLDHVTRADELTVGTKAANLGELASIGIPVPAGFILPVGVYQEFLKANRLDRLITQTLGDLDVQDIRSLHAAAQTIQTAIQRASLPPKLETLILEAYQELRLRPDGNSRLAVRPSIPPLDGSLGDMAGHNTTVLAVSGNRELVGAIVTVWASLFEPRAIDARHRAELGDLSVPAAILIQALVEASVSGVMLTADPNSVDHQALTIEAAWGLGEAVVRGLVTPDHYEINRQTFVVTDQEIAEQTWKLERPTGERAVAHVPVAGEAQRLPKLDPIQLRSLAEIGLRLEQHFQFAQNIEWALARGQFRIVQASLLPRIRRTVTVQRPGSSAPTQLRPLLTGTGATLGTATGPVRIIHRPDDLAQVNSGDIVVSELATPDILPALRTIAGLITDAGGRTSHIALMATQAGVPLVVGTGVATHILHEGQTVTMDGSSGKVYLGKSQIPDTRYQIPNRRGAPVHTATKLMLNIGNPSEALAAAHLGADGVGLLRAEFMVAALGEHPKALLDEGRIDEYRRHLASSIEIIARAFHPHPVVYRATDFKTNEYRGLRGGETLEPHEENPMLGWRGAARYLAEPELFQAELQALKEVRAKRGWDNVQLMIPFVRTVEELRQVKAFVVAAGLSAERTFKLRMMVEVPSNVFAINTFLDEGLDGVSIGSNDLTQLILGIDRDSPSETLKDEFNELDPAVLSAIQTVIEACTARHVPVAVCGQAAGTNPRFAEFLVRHGVTTLSVDPAFFETTRSLVASIEHQLTRIQPRGAERNAHEETYSLRTRSEAAM